MSRRTLKIVILPTLIVAVVMAFVAVRWFPHIAFRLNHAWLWRTWSLPADRPPTPIRPLPKVGIPGNFVRCRFGSMTFRAPSKMVANPQFRTLGSVSTVQLSEGKRSLLVFLPNDNRAMLSALQQELADQGGLTSIVRLRIEAYTAKNSDFRWSMSSQQLARHRFLLGYGALANVLSEEVETRFDKHLEGLLLIREYGAFFEWTGDGGATAGTLVFDTDKSPTRLEWVRQVAASVQHDGGFAPPNLTVKEVEALFKVEN